MMIIYVANDGKVFLTEQECQKYEEELKKREILRERMVESAKSISEYCKSLGDTCKDCPFIDNSICKLTMSTAKYPSEWKV